MSKSLLSAFDIEHKETNNVVINDYDVFTNKDLLDELRTKIIENIIDTEIPSNENINDFINDEIDRSIEGYDLSNLQRNYIYNLISDEINGYGPINELLKDKDITEIMINGPKDIYIEIDGRIIKDDSVSFINDEHIIRTVQRLIQPMGRTIDTANPMVDSRLSDGSRINAIIPPLSVKGPVVTIRKFKDNMSCIDELLRVGSLTPDMARFLAACVKAKLNIIVCGGTGSGKTTLLNILGSFINDYERIITIEDAQELRLKQEHVINLETRTVSYKSGNDVTIRDLVINALRMRPDRIIVGECRGKEAFDMLQAMNTGHDGSMTTLHANSCIDSLNRLETMVLMSGLEIPIRAVREYIVNAIDLVVNIDRMSDGKRKITNISEVTKLVNDEIELKTIFEFSQKGLTNNGEVDGEYKTVKHKPTILNKINSKGINEIDDLFK